MKSKFWQNCEILDKVGEGSLGTVYKAVTKDNSICAIKHISLPREPQEIELLIKNGLITKPDEANKYYANIIRKEIEIMRNFNGNPYIIDYYDIYQETNPDGSKIDFYIKMEYAEDLTRYFNNKEINVNEVIKLGIDICSALELCSSINIIHNDIKPSNIFVGNDGTYKLGDFSIAIEENNLNNFGTLNYISPELYKKQGATSSTDIYSLGLVMYKLINGQLPFMNEFNDEKKAFETRMSGKPIPPINNLDKRLMQIITKACSFDSQERYKNATEMKEELEALPHINFDNIIVKFLTSKAESTLDIYENNESLIQNSKIIKNNNNARTKMKSIFYDKNNYKKILGIIMMFIIIILLFRSCTLNRKCNSGYINRNGLCVKGYYYCKNGYTLNGDNKCQKTLESIDAKVTYTCKSGYTLNGEVCVSNDIKEPQFVYKCADGYTLNGTKCERIESVDAAITYSCPSGYVSAGDQCVTVSNIDATKKYICEDSSYNLSGTNCKKNVTTKATPRYTCDSGGSLKGTICEYTSSPRYLGIIKSCHHVQGTYNDSDGKCHYEREAKFSGYSCQEGTLDGNGNCRIIKEKAATIKYSCPSGYAVVGNQCAKTTGVKATVKYVCADGTQLKGNKCYTTISTDSVGMYACPEGYVASGAACYKDDFPSAIKKYTCSRVYTLNGGKCEKYEIIDAKAHYND